MFSDINQKRRISHACFSPKISNRCQKKTERINEMFLKQKIPFGDFKSLKNVVLFWKRSGEGGEGGGGGVAVAERPA